jgi:hypothetical protein
MSRVSSEIIEIKSMSLNIYEDIEFFLIFYMCLNYFDMRPKDCTSGLVISGGDIYAWIFHLRAKNLPFPTPIPD